MPEQTGSGEVLKNFSTRDLLQEIGNRFAKSQDPQEQALVNAINAYSVVDQQNQVSTELNNLEDEFVQAVKAVAVFGKFPQGLNFKEKELIPPQGKWGSDFMTYSPTGFHPLRGRGWNYYDFIGRCLSAIDDRSYDCFPQQLDLKKKHFLVITPYDDPKRGEEYKEGYALLIYSTLQDLSVVDDGGRHARSVNISFLMSMNKAQQFIRVIEEKTNGADIVEQFVQKAAPGVMANRLGEPGVHRVQATELVILDTRFLNNLLTARNRELFNENSSLLVGPRFLGSVDQAVVKQYSQPIGFGTPPS